MIHIKNGQSCKALLCATAVFALLAHPCGSQSQVIGQPQTIVAKDGDDVILPCQLNPAVDAVSLTVEWARPDLKPRFVHLRREGVDLLTDQNPSYSGRTSMFKDRLKRGDLSLTLSKVKPSDEGTYRCFLPTQKTESEVKLAVASASSSVLRISRLSSESSGVVLQCESKGWSAQPEVFWLDGEGNLLSAGPPETVRGPDDLYTVSSRVTVETRHSNNVTCRVTQKETNQIRDTQIYLPDDLFLVPSFSVGRIMIVIIVGLLCLCAIAALITFILRPGDTSASQKANTGNLEECQPLTVMTAVLEGNNNKNGNLIEEVNKNKEGLNKVIELLTEQKSELEKQKEQVTLMLKELIDKEPIVRDRNKRERDKRRKSTRTEILSAMEEMIEKITDMMKRLEEDQKQMHDQLNEAKPSELEENIEGGGETTDRLTLR